MSSDIAGPLSPLDEFDRIGHVTLVLRAELDRTVMSFGEVADLKPGSLIRLPSSAGETISIHAGDVHIGSGEVLVVDGVLTVRISDLASVSGRPEVREASSDDSVRESA